MTLLFISHDMGGGIQRHIEQLTTLLAGRVKVATLLSQPGPYVKLSFSARDWYFHQRDQFQDLLAILAAMRVDLVHYHHLSGLLPAFWQLPESLQLPYYITLHDFSLISGATTLSDNDGFYQADFGRQAEPSNALLPAWCDDIYQWQTMNSGLLNGAAQVFCPSQFTRDVFLAHYPDAKYRQCYHPDWELDAPYPPVCPGTAEGGKLRVGVLGMLSREKGADRLEEVAVAARAGAQPLEFVLFGKAYRRLHESVTTLGPYQDSELAGLMEAQAIDLVWFPALCAETYSYTLSHCLRQGMPVLAPDVGVFPERLAGRPLSYLFPYRCSTGQLVEQLDAIRQRLQAAGEPQEWAGQPVPERQVFLYRRDYPGAVGGHTATARVNTGDFDAFTNLPMALKLAAGKTRLLAWLVRGNDSKVLAFLQRIVPYALQKRAKRLLSEKPLHELGE